MNCHLSEAIKLIYLKNKVGVADGQFIPVTAFVSPRPTGMNVSSTEREQKDLELSIFSETRKRP